MSSANDRLNVNASDTKDSEFCIEIEKIKMTSIVNNSEVGTNLSRSCFNSSSAKSQSNTNIGAGSPGDTPLSDANLQFRQVSIVSERPSVSVNPRLLNLITGLCYYAKLNSRKLLNKQKVNKLNLEISVIRSQVEI